MTEFYSVNGQLKVSEARHQKKVALCKQASKDASLACMEAWSTTDFRDDLARVSVPTLLIQGELHLIAGSPHGCNLTHAEEFNEVLLTFLAR